jgi:hypothetical protein
VRHRCGRLGDRISESAGGSSVLHGRNHRGPPHNGPQRPARLRHRARYENSVFFGFTFDFSKLHFLEPGQGEISVQKMMRRKPSIGSCAIDRTSEFFALHGVASFWAPIGAPFFFVCRRGACAVKPGKGMAYSTPTMLPGFVEPCLPSPADRPPTGPEWVHEIKHDGVHRGGDQRVPASSMTAPEQLRSPPGVVWR